VEFLNLENEYEIAWAIYLVAGLGCFWMWTFFTRWMWRFLREPLWVLMAALLFTPVQLSVEGTVYAPAGIALLLEIVFKKQQDSWAALANLAVVLLVLFAVYVLFALMRWLLLRQLKPAQPKPQQEPAPET